MAKKVLVLLGSPRKKGNSAILANQITKGAKSEKAKVKTIFLHGKNIAPCKACMICKKKDSKGCSIKDAMQDIYSKLLKTDAWVIASPVYNFTMSAQIKIFMERCYALPAYRENPYKGKKVAIAMAYGGEDPFDSGCVNALRTFQDWCAYKEVPIVGIVYGSATAPGEIRSNKKIMQEAFDLGKTLAAE